MDHSVLLITAGALSLLIGIIHSVLGEVLIFSRLRQGSIVPTVGGERLRERHVRILWANWHLVTILGFACAALLFRAGLHPSLPFQPFMTTTITWAMAAGGLLVLYATKGRHPGWAGLLAIAVLTAVAAF